MNLLWDQRFLSADCEILDQSSHHSELPRDHMVGNSEIITGED